MSGKSLSLHNEKTLTPPQGCLFPPTHPTSEDSVQAQIPSGLPQPGQSASDEAPGRPTARLPALASLTWVCFSAIILLMGLLVFACYARHALSFDDIVPSLNVLWRSFRRVRFRVVEPTKAGQGPEPCCLPLACLSPLGLGPGRVWRTPAGADPDSRAHAGGCSYIRPPLAGRRTSDRYGNPSVRLSHFNSIRRSVVGLSCLA